MRSFQLQRRVFTLVWMIRDDTREVLFGATQIGYIILGHQFGEKLRASNLYWSMGRIILNGGSLG